MSQTDNTLSGNWLKLALRLMSLAPRDGQGQAIMSLTLLLENGEPKLWSKPSVMMLEPKVTSATEVLMAFVRDVDR